MLFKYLKGTSSSVLASVFTYFLLTRLLTSDFADFGIGELLSESYLYILFATFFGYIVGLFAISVLHFYSGENLFTIDIFAIFTATGIIIGLGLELLTVFAAAPFFLIAAFVGSLAFLAVQKIDNKFIGWSIIAVHLGMIFLSPLISDYMS